MKPPHLDAGPAAQRYGAPRASRVRRTSAPRLTRAGPAKGVRRPATDAALLQTPLELDQHVTLPRRWMMCPSTRLRATGQTVDRLSGEGDASAARTPAPSAHGAIRDRGRVVQHGLSVGHGERDPGHRHSRTGRRAISALSLGWRRPGAVAGVSSPSGLLAVVPVTVLSPVTTHLPPTFRTRG